MVANAFNYTKGSDKTTYYYQQVFMKGITVVIVKFGMENHLLTRPSMYQALFPLLRIL